MPVKRTNTGSAKPRFNYTQSQFKTEFLPDPSLAQFENEAPGYIRSVGSSLNRLFVKEQVAIPIYQKHYRLDGTGYYKQTGTRIAYVWRELISDTD